MPDISRIPEIYDAQSLLHSAYNLAEETKIMDMK